MNHAEQIAAVIAVLPVAGIVAIEKQHARRDSAETGQIDLVDDDDGRVARPANGQQNGQRDILAAIFDAGRKLPNVAGQLSSLRRACISRDRAFAAIAAGAGKRETALERGAAEHFGELRPPGPPADRRNP